MWCKIVEKCKKCVKLRAPTLHFFHATQKIGEFPVTLKVVSSGKQHLKKKLCGCLHIFHIFCKITYNTLLCSYSLLFMCYFQSPHKLKEYIISFTSIHSFLFKCNSMQQTSFRNTIKIGYINEISLYVRWVIL